jgi:xanthine dehydrogenase accessory factor
MRDVMETIEQWQGEGQQVALATVVQTWGSSPRQAGAKMALTPGGNITGSVSGGCVEGAVYEEGVEALKSGAARLLHFGVADETAWEVGLACGGSIDVFVQPLPRDFFKAERKALMENETFAVVTVVGGPAELMGKAVLAGEKALRFGSLGSPVLDAPAAELAQQALAKGQSRRATLAEGVEAFVEVVLPPPTLIVVGGVHITVALVALAKTLGYATIVVDPRKAFGSEERFPHADRLIQAWPDEALAGIPLTRATAVAMLTHDPKLDDPALKLALPSPAFYVGALGSRTTQAKRRQRLLDAGLRPEDVDRLHGPIGLELNASTPEEIALSIMAQIVAEKNKVIG